MQRDCDRRGEPPDRLTEPICHLGQIVCSKTKEGGVQRNVTCTQRGTGRFNHNTETVIKIRPRFGAHFGGNRIDAGLYQFNLSFGAY